MGHPSSYYIKYLVAEHWHDDDYDHSAVCLTLYSYGLPAVTSDEFTLLQLAVAPPQNFAFSNKRHAESVAFMKDEGLYTLWVPKGENKRVLAELIHQQRLRHHMDILLMGGTPTKYIAEHLNKRFRHKKPIAKDMVETYRHFFWNTDLPGVREWDNLLLGYPHKDALMAAYFCGPDQALYRVGGNPKITDPKKPLREANRQAHWVLQGLRYQPDTSENAQLRSRLTHDLRVLHDAIQGEGADAEAHMKKFRQFLVEKIPAAVSEWDSVIGEEGSYSGDGKDHKDDAAT